MSLIRLTNQVSLGRTTAAITFTRFNKTVEPRNAGQARAKRIPTNHSCVAYFKQPLALAFTLVLTATVLTALLFSATPALAARGHEFTTTFGKPCTAEPCGEALKKPTGVAVNEASGDVYVVDTGSNRVARFSASGGYLGQFDGSGTFEVEGKVESGAPAGSLGRTGEIETGAFSEPEGIAVDNSCVLRKLAEPKLAQATCEAEDPSNGDVYVVDAGHRVVDKFAPDGEYLGQISEAEEGTPFSSEPLDGVAVDQKGTVWVFREHPVIDGFSNGIPNKFIEAIAVVGLGDFPLPGFAVDGEGNFYVRHPVGQNAVPLISKVSHKTGRVVSEEVDKEESSAVATEQSNSDVLIDNLTSIGVFNSEGVELERLGAGELSEGSGIGVNAAAGSFYVADEAAGQVMVFGPQLPSPPRVEGESVTAITSTGAQLEGEVNPRSEPGEAATEYHFEYGRCVTASSCAGSPYEASAPVPDGQLAADFDLHAVSAPIQGLTPSTTYHYRVLARNSHNQPGEYEPGKERTFTTEAAGGELVLPDNRGWELVSPPDKQGSKIEPIAEVGVVQAAASGDGITYLANAPTESGTPGNANEVQVLSSRGAGAWSSQDIAIAHTAATGAIYGQGPEYKFFDPELTLSAVQPQGQFNPGLSPEASESTAYLHELSGACGEACFQPLVTGKAGFANVDEGVQFGEEERCVPPAHSGNTTTCGPEFLGATEDLSHVVLHASAELKPGARRKQLYEWAGGQLAQVSVLPNGEPVAEETGEYQAKLGLEDRATRGAISAEGERIVWEAAPELYLRDMEHKETVQLDKAEACPGCISGGGRFQFANAQGSRVLFTDAHRLTKDSGAEPGGGNPKADLYECKIVIEGGKLACNLSDLTPKTVTEESAAVQGSVLGASEDGETVYFVADGVLSTAANARGEQAAPGTCEDTPEYESESSACNLYVRRGASTSFIARLSGADGHDWDAELSRQPTHVTTDGGFLELMSARSLTGYDNRDVTSDRPAAEVYLYDAASGRLSCASCDPTGARPMGVEYKKLEQGSGGLVGGDGIWPEKALVAANVPGWTAIASAGQAKERYQPRYLSNEGRLFFNTVNALVPQDSNGTQDVYEFEPLGIKGPEGEEDCTSAMSTFSESNGGCVSLISSGRSAQESAFMDASVSGDDVFFLTSAQLSPLDVDNARDIYDAHVCSAGSPCITFPNTQSPPCTTEASCKPAPTPQPSIFGAPASSTFQGLGNPAPVAAVKAKAKPLTRAQKLAKALTVCHRDKKAKRQACEKQARKKYGPLKKAKAKGKGKK
jgi:NHL repeat